MKSGKYTEAFPGKPFLKEFVLKTDKDIDALNARLAENGIMGGLNLGDGMIMLAVTEKRTKEEIDFLITLMTED